MTDVIAEHAAGTDRGLTLERELGYPECLLLCGRHADEVIVLDREALLWLVHSGVPAALDALPAAAGRP